MTDVTPDKDLHVRIPVLDDKGDVITLVVTLTDESAKRLMFMSAHRTHRLGQLFSIIRDAVIEWYQTERKSGS
jgi:hypothetical protein